MQQHLNGGKLYHKSTSSQIRNHNLCPLLLEGWQGFMRKAFCIFFIWIKLSIRKAALLWGALQQWWQVQWRRLWGKASEKKSRKKASEAEKVSCCRELPPCLQFPTASSMLLTVNWSQAARGRPVQSPRFHSDCPRSRKLEDRLELSVDSGVQTTICSVNDNFEQQTCALCEVGTC